MKKNNKISIANIIALVGCAFLLLFTFGGQLLLRKGDITSTLLIALGVIVCFLSLLVALIKVKQVENDFRRWRYVEYALLGVYCVAMYFLSPGAIHFISLDKDNVKQTAETDIESILDMFQKYEKFEIDALNSTVEGLRNACSSEMISVDLGNFMEENSISCSDIENYKDDMTDMIVGDEPIEISDSRYVAYKKYELRIDSTLNGFLRHVNIWDSYDLMNIAKEDTIIAKDVALVLTKFSKVNAKSLPKIKMENDKYCIVQQEQSVEIDAPMLNLHNILCKKSRGTLFSWILYVLMHVAILLNYLVVNRSTTLEIKKISLGGAKL